MTDKQRLYSILTLQEDYQQDSHAIGSISNNQEGIPFWHQAEVSRFLFEQGFRPQYPDNKPFAVCISHDVDLLYNHNSVEGNLLWGTVNMLTCKTDKAKYHFKSLGSSKLLNESWRIEHTLEILEQYGAKSSFYFLALDSHERDFNYHLEQVSEEIKLIEAQGHEMGLHGGHDAYNNHEKLKAEKEAVGKFATRPIQGYRSHFLNLSIPQTWENLAQLDFQYDASLGFSREVGFRNGMCYPFRPYNEELGAWSNIFVLPLMIMDVALFLKKNVNYQQALSQCKRIIDEVAALQGVCTLLWHNNYMQGEMGRFFKEILQYVNSLNAWLPHSLELINWWKKNQYAQEMEQIFLDQLISQPINE